MAAFLSVLRAFSHAQGIFQEREFGCVAGNQLAIEVYGHARAPDGEGLAARDMRQGQMRVRTRNKARKQSGDFQAAVDALHGDSIEEAVIDDRVRYGLHAAPNVLPIADGKDGQAQFGLQAAIERYPRMKGRKAKERGDDTAQIG